MNNLCRMKQDRNIESNNFSVTCLIICLITLNSDYFTHYFLHNEQISKGSFDFSIFHFEFKVEKSIDSANSSNDRYPYSLR